jgi:hypothetical protein
MAEIITEDQPRIKFRCELDPEPCSDLSEEDERCFEGLADLLSQAEKASLTPLLNDGLVAGNCAALVGRRLFVSRSGKRASERASFVEVLEFDRSEWRCRYRRRRRTDGADDDAPRPSSDTPLLAALLLGAVGGGDDTPLAPGARFVLHGHALADDDDEEGGGGGLAAARALGAAVSEKETLFSTPEDLSEVEKLLRRRPYDAAEGGGGAGGLYVRRGHGFFLLGRTIEELERGLARVVAAVRDVAAAAAAARQAQS